jgi:hypothetical protein
MSGQSWLRVASRSTVITLAVATLIALCGCSASNTSGASSTSGSGTHPSARPSAKPDFTYLALGDSNVYGNPDDCGSCTPYPSLVAKQLAASSGKTIALFNGAQHNRLTAGALLDEINQDLWGAIPADAKTPSPKGAIAAADIITITLNDNSIPWTQDENICNNDYGAKCIGLAEKPYIKDLDGVLTEIASLRAGKPTAIRVTTEYNFLIPGKVYFPDWPVSAIKQAKGNVRLFLDQWNKDVCATAKKHGAVCVDIYHAINGAKGLMPLPDGWFSPMYGDLNQGGHDFIAKELLKQGWAPLQLS